MVLDKPQEPEHVSCTVCMKEIPRSEATASEAVDYVLYFCGTECFEKWRETRDENDPDPHETPGRTARKHGGKDTR